MKKKILFGGLMVMLVAVTGCGKVSKTMTCTMSGEVVKGTKINSEYKVTYTGKYVDLVESTETVDSDTKAILSTYQKTVESMYSPYKDLKYYDYDIKLNGNQLVTKVTINYAKIDTDKLVEINSAIGKLMKDGKVELDTLKEIYEKQMGATCK